MRTDQNEFSDWVYRMPAMSPFPIPLCAQGAYSKNTLRSLLANFFSFQPALNYGYFKPIDQPMAEVNE